MKINKKAIKNLSQEKTISSSLTKNINGGASVMPTELLDPIFTRL